MTTQSERKHILVIGCACRSIYNPNTNGISAGVVGLQCAKTILEEGQGQYRVSVVAEYMPGDDPGIYASAWAGAQWRSHEPSYTEAAEWDVQTYRYWDQLVKEGLEGTGIAAEIIGKHLPSRTISSAPQRQGERLTRRRAAPVNAATTDSPELPDPWWASHVKSYKRLDATELPPNTALGVVFDTFTIDVQRYLAFLLRGITESGAQVTRVRLPTDLGLGAAVQAAAVALGVPQESQFWAVINASGIQAKELVKDTSLYPIRGQTVQVRGIADYCTTRLGVEEKDRVAVMPRPSASLTVIGVTVEPNVASTEVEQARVAELLNAAKPYCPELLNGRGEFDVVKVGVGIRPGRKGGARIELEQIDGLKIVHAYGSAGAGYQNSVGIARKVLGLL